MDLAEQLIDDIERFKKRRTAATAWSLVWCGSTEVYREPARRARDARRRSRRACRSSDDDIAPSQIYAYACAQDAACRTPTARRTCRVDTPALHGAGGKQNGVPIGGKDFKTGQTLMKTILAPGFKARLLGLEGWYSTNILGNRDGEVLDDPESFKTQGSVEARRARAHPPAAPLPRPLRQHPPRRAHQLLPAARRQQRGLGQHRHLRVARLPDADQGRLPLPRLDPGGADRPRPRAVHGPRAARGHERHPGVAVVLLEEPDDARRACTPSTTCSSSS